MNPHILIGPSVRIFTALWGLAAAQALYIILKEAYNIRLYAITEYVFVLNLIGCHADAFFVLGRYSTKLYRAYTSFYIVGTCLALQVPVGDLLCV